MLIKKLFVSNFINALQEVVALVFKSNRIHFELD